MGGIAAARHSIFFAYIGFDAVSTAAQEAKNPQRDMPIGILGSLVDLHHSVHPGLARADRTGELQDAERRRSGGGGNRCDRRALGQLAGEGRRGFGLATVMLVMLLGQSRVFFSMSRDGLLPKWASAIHPKFRTPWIRTCLVGRFGLPAGVTADRRAGGTGQHRHAAGLHHCLRRRMDPAAAASGTASSIQDAAGAAGADPGNHQRVLPDVALPLLTWIVVGSSGWWWGC